MSDDRINELVQTYGPLYEGFFEVDGMELYLDLLPLLADGRPVSFERLGNAVGRPRDEVPEAIRSLPNIECDDDGRIVGAGLTLEPTRHRFRLDDVTLYTWCAWDALIYPPMLERTAEVESTSPATGETIRMTVTPDRVEDLEPRGAVLSFPEPDLERACHDVREAFCNRSNFFRTGEAAREWIEGRDKVDILTVEEGFELGRRLCDRWRGDQERRTRRRAQKKDQEFACDMTALEDAERKRHVELSRELLKSVDDIRERPDGYSLVLPASDKTVRKAATFISRERRCCPFLDFTLEVQGREGPILLTLSGSEGVKAYLERTLVFELKRK